MNRIGKLWTKGTKFQNHINYALVGHKRTFHCCNVTYVSSKIKTSTSSGQQVVDNKTTSAATSAPAADEDAIVISGISGRFPQSDSMEEFKKNLFDGVDMVSEQQRFTGLSPTRFGFIKNMDKFDANFFGIVPKLADAMDPQQRKLMEATFEAIVDSGMSPQGLKGSSTGVYVGTMGGETTDYHLLHGNADGLEGYGALGIPNFMQANRLSYTFDFKGPSMIMSTGCSASLIALESAVQAIKSGNCEAAIVAGATIHVNPAASCDLLKLNALAPDGKCKAFDDSANGFVRSEAIVAMLIQKKKAAKRVYATIRHIKSSSDGYKNEGLVFPSGPAQEDLLRKIYSEAGIDPGAVAYFEAHGTGTPAGDPQELNAISNVFCKVDSRKQPLLIGSVKSNMGHGESAAGLCSIAKVVVGIQEGVIPANLHFNEPNSYVKHVFDGSLKVVTEATPWNGGFVGISGFGLGGTNCHVILESGPKSDGPAAATDVVAAAAGEKTPILIPFSGRTEETVEQSLNEACDQGTNPQFVGLLHQVFKQNIPGHPVRGYGIVRPGEEENIIQVQKCEAGTRPLWFIFPGMGSQWNTMGKDLMKFDAFVESIHRSKITLKNAGVDLEALLQPGNPTIFSHIRDSLVSITAVQVALYDTIMSLGLKPDGFVGHSSGEILCAYADGCLTAEETLLVGNARGRAFQETMEQPGGMAAVGLSWAETLEKLPAGIYPACHNAATNVSVSGPLEDIRKFVQKLQSQGVFAKEINSCNCAPHSPLVYPATDRLFKYMNEIYQDERPRTSRWISSSIPQEDWDSPMAATSSPAYHVYNMGNPVLFHDAIQHVPENAVVVEIAPHGLFQAILKGSLSKNNILVAPMHSMVEDKVSYFLSSVGKIYNSGMDMDMSTLYPSVNFPVSSQTPMISSLVKWDHEQSWNSPIVENIEKLLGGGASTKVDLTEKPNKFLEGHRLDSRTVYPATGYLVMAWKNYARSLGVEYEDLPVTFENVSFERATFLNEDKPTEFSFALLNGSGAFEIREEGAVVVRGNIQAPEDVTKKIFNLPPVKIPENPERMSLKTADVYKELKLRGYNYSGEFRGIKNIDNEGKWAEVGWNKNWVSFLDTVLQTVSLSIVTRNTAVPVRLQQVTINPKALFDYIDSKADSRASDKDVHVPVSIHRDLNTIQCPGVEMRGLTAMVIPRKRQVETLSVEEYNFSPYFDGKSTNPSVSINSTVSGLIDLVLENAVTSKLKVVDVFGKSENSLTESVYQIMSSKPRYQADITMLSVPNEVEKLDDKIKALGNVLSRGSVDQLIPDTAADLVFLDESSLLGPISSTLNDNGYIVLRSDSFKTELPESLLKISEKVSTEGHVSLFKKTPAIAPKTIESLSVDAEDFSWLPKLQSLMATAAAGSQATVSPSRIYLTSQNDSQNGIVGLVKCLRLEPGGQNIRCILDPAGKLNLNFETPDATLSQILGRDLVMNIFKNDTLGSYRHYPLVQDVTLPTKEVEHAYINTLTTGDLTSLRWIESPLKYVNQQQQDQLGGGKLCKVNYASLNFRDIMLATGKLPIDTASSHGDCVMGFEFSGVDQQGNRVMGMMPSKALATSVLVDPDFVWKIPDHWSLEEAATVPIVYATAYYSLFNRARLQPGQSVLIHSGTGGVGQAAIALALDANCEVYTTVGTAEKRKYIKELFPSLKDENIGNSRDCSFEPQILQLTKGKGVNVVLNSLADDKLQASVRCLGMHGKFLEIGAFDAFQNTPLGMGCFLKNIDFQGIFLNQIFSKSDDEKESLRKLLTNGISSGVVKPLPRTVFPHDKIEDAFRFMAGGKHMGKVLIKVQDEQDKDKSPKVQAVTRSYFHPDKSYVIVGGLGGLGLEVANWMVERGAKKLVLVSRSGVTNGYQDLCMRKWEEKGVSVDTPKIDLSCYETAETFIKDLTKNGGSVGGIFNSGLVLKDALIENQTKEMFKAVGTPKIQVTKNLDKLTRQYCKDLDYFVAFSSGACGRGNAEQSNYGLANGVMEQICELRKQDGLHGLAMQWGVIGEVGFVAEKLLSPTSTGEESFEGTVAQRISSCLDVLDLALQQSSPVYSSMVLADKTRKKTKKAGLLTTLSSVFGIKDFEKISPATKLIDLGMDSLIGMELKQTLERDYDLPLTPNEIRVMTFGDLIAIDAGTFVKGASSSNKSSAAASSSSPSSVAAADSNAMFKARKDVILKLHSAEQDDLSPSPLFFVHGLEGHPDVLRTLAAKLKVDSYGFQFPANYNSIEEMAKIYIEEMKTIQPEGPYNIAGYSSGATVACEMAMQLEKEHNDDVSNLIVLDGCCTWTISDELDFKEVFKQAIEMFENTVGNGRLTDVVKAKIVDKLTDNKEHNIELLVEMTHTVFPDIEKDTLSDYIEQYFKFADLAFQYRPPKNFSGKTTLIKANHKSYFLSKIKDENHNLREVCDGSLSVFTVDGDHETFLGAENVDQTAEIFNNEILNLEKNDLSDSEQSEVASSI